ncbi:hypothetical protein [Streptomyces sp. CA2R106]|uniref:hypothetical protein n=1 Tax=Streptomyces sp. CA2R106 TaxID=3120153 RepID=UPI00300AC312
MADKWSVKPVEDLEPREVLWPWPELPERVAQQLELIAAEESASEDEDENEDDSSELADPDTGVVFDGLVPRPWNLPELGEKLQAAVLGWLDDVVMWHNHAYGWQEEQIIPACWQLHEGLALDLAALAFGRIDAYATATAAYVGRWHSDWEDFQRRMVSALGETGRDCRRGDHKHPGEYAATAVREVIMKRRAAAPAAS